MKGSICSSIRSAVRLFVTNPSWKSGAVLLVIAYLLDLEATGVFSYRSPQNILRLLKQFHVVQSYTTKEENCGKIKISWPELKSNTFTSKFCYNCEAKAIVWWRFYQLPQNADDSINPIWLEYLFKSNTEVEDLWMELCWEFIALRKS